MNPDAEDRFHALGRTAAELLHDLAADLQVLRGWARLVADGVRTGRATPPDAGALEDEAERVGRLIADLVDWLADPHPRGSFAPLERIRAVVDRVDRREGVVPLDLRGDVPLSVHIAGPPTFFDRIAANLIRNAVRHADRRVRVALLPDSRDGAEGVRLRVEDDGGGIDPALQARLFTPFARGTADGHGLGLSSTAWLVEQLAGAPPESSRSPLGGACIEVWFPARAAPSPAAHVGFPLGGLRVVLVDDDPSVRRVLVALLRRERMVAEGMDLAPDLPERLAAIQPDLVLLDRHLGDASGLDLWRTLRVLDPALAHRTALLTGALEAGDAADEPVVLRKPLDLSALRRFAARALGGSVADPAGPRVREASPGHAGSPGRAYAAVFREVLRALDAADLDAAVAGLQRWTVGIDGRSVPPTLLAELGETAWKAREALRQGELEAARSWVGHGLSLLGEEADAA